ncbi:YjcQ family protein [Paenibacillus sp. IHBB 3054]|uniref:YjcQ family protein n=1 Tax=Paenibacillus sp. IHBB 3054 TaxID=3425689 RepID=UPI003F67503D
MFKSTDDLLDALTRVLINFREGIPREKAGLNEDDFQQVLSEAYEKGFVKGLIPLRMVGKTGTQFKIAADAKITLEGLSFLESSIE